MRRLSFFLKRLVFYACSDEVSARARALIRTRASLGKVARGGGVKCGSYLDD